MSRARLASLLAIGCIIALSLSLCLIAPAAAQHEDEADDNEPAGDEQDEPATSTAAPLKHHHHLHVHKKGDTTPKAGHSRASDEVLREASEAMGPGVRISKEALRSGLAGKTSTAKPKAGKADEPEASSGDDEHEAEGSRFGLGKFWGTTKRPRLPPRAPSTTSKAPSTTSKAPSTTSKKPSNTSKAPSSGKQLAALSADEEDDSKDSEEDYTDEGEYKARVCVTTTTKSPTTTTTSAPRNTTTTTRWPRIYPVKTTRRGGYIINR